MNSILFAYFVPYSACSYVAPVYFNCILKALPRQQNLIEASHSYAKALDITKALSLSNQRVILTKNLGLGHLFGFVGKAVLIGFHVDKNLKMKFKMLGIFKQTKGKVT